MNSILRIESGAPMSQAVVANGFIFLAGQVAGDPSQDVENQTRQVLAEIDRLLGSIGKTNGSIGKTNALLPRTSSADAAGVLPAAGTKADDPRSLWVLPAVSGRA